MTQRAIRHLDLFSGIGGFALATEMVWGEVEHVFCDNEPFAQAILQKHWPNSPIYDDIRTLTADTESWRQQQLAVERQPHAQATIPTAPYLLTGGFPCQPFSQAGRRQGTSDDRYLWPEMFRVIKEFKPRWVIAENVEGLTTWNEGMVLETVCTDLESESYEVQPFIIPAVAVGAPHRRNRVWIVAYSQCAGERECWELKTTRQCRKFSRVGSHQGPDWDQHWSEVATRLCRVDDGIPRRLDRAARLKGLGNAIVPQVAAQIMRSIRVADEHPHLLTDNK